MSLIAAIMLLLVCVGAKCVQVDFKPVVTTLAPKIVGYEIAKSHPELVDAMLGFANTFAAITNPGEAEDAFDSGRKWLVEKLSKDPYHQMLIEELVNSIEINIEPDTAIAGFKLDAIKELVANFAAGVEAAKRILKGQTIGGETSLSVLIMP